MRKKVPEESVPQLKVHPALVEDWSLGLSNPIGLFTVTSSSSCRGSKALCGLPRHSNMCAHTAMQIHTYTHEY